MIFFRFIFPLTIFLYPYECASVKKSEDNLINKEHLDLVRYDVDNIAVNVENLFVDLLKPFLKKPSDPDEGSGETQIPTDYESLETTTEGMIDLLGVKNAPDPIKTEETGPGKNKRIHRNKRAAPTPKFVPKTAPPAPTCAPKTAQEQKLEQQHIGDLKEEVKKLRDLVVLLRDQRDILNILNQTKGPQIPKESLIKGLDQLHKKERELAVDLPDVKKANHEELQFIKLQVKEAIHALNETRTILAKEQLRENTLEGQLEEQKSDIILLKYMVKVLYNSTFPSQGADKNDSIVGSGLNFFSKPTEKSVVKAVNEEKVEDSKGKSRESNKSEPKNARASDLSDLVKIMEVLNKPEKKTEPSAEDIGRLLDALNKPEKKTDLADLQEILNKRKKNEDALQQMMILQKLLNNKDKALGKSDDIDLELKSLEEAINRLRPKEDGFSFDTGRIDDNSASFQAMLNKIIANPGQGRRPTTIPQAMALSSIVNRDPFVRPTAGYYDYYGPYNYAGAGGYNYGDNQYYNYPPAPPPPPYNYNPGYNSQYQAGGSSYYNNNNNNYKGQNDFFLYSQPNSQYSKAPGGASPGTPYGNSPPYPTNANQYAGNPQPAANYASDYKATNVEDLKAQIYSLQTVINDLNRPEYTQKPEDKQTLYDLEKQINELKNVVSVLNTDNNSYGAQTSYGAPAAPATAEQSSYSGKYRRKRSIEDNEVEDDKFMNSAAKFLDKMLDSPKKQPDMEDVKTKLKDLKKQLESSLASPSGSPAQRSNIYSSMYSSPYDYQNNLYSNSMSVNEKFDFDEGKRDLISKLLLKIIDKTLRLLPDILKKIFGFSLNELTSDYGGYGDKYAIFKSIGVFGYLPLIVLKLVDVFTYFMNTLKKNKFLKSFVVPTAVLGLAAGGILFLIWFLQSDNEIEYNKPPQQPYYYNNPYRGAPPNSYNPPVYSRSYFDNI